MRPIPLAPPRIESLSWGHKFHTTADVLRLDGVHPIVSGNKWFKLQYYLAEAGALGKKILLSFGGAYSNHIVALAAAARVAGLTSIGIIRGEEPAVLSPTLLDARSEGMDLRFISRSDYHQKLIPASLSERYDPKDIYFIPEGGYGRTGARGAATILQLEDTSAYTHILAAVGTGTMLAGLTLACGERQQVIGIPVIKNPGTLVDEIRALLPADRWEKFRLINDHRLGGYARFTPELIDFMNGLYAEEGIPTDFVYTGKLFHAAHDLLQSGALPAGSRVLLIHSGGLQGNRSLTKGTLIF